MKKITSELIGNLGPLITVDENMNCCRHCGNWSEASQKTEINITYGPAIPVMGIFPKDYA